MAYRVRILKNGSVTTIVDIDDYDTACSWARETMSLNDSLEQGRWAAVIESGTVLTDPFGMARDLFMPDGDLKEGLVLDQSLLHDPRVDIQGLFGL